MKRRQAQAFRYLLTLLAGLIGGLATFIVHDGLLGARPLSAMPVASAPQPDQLQSPGGVAAEIAAPSLASYILQSRDQAIAAGVRPIPPGLRAKLARYFDADLLDRVRYRIGRATASSLASFAFSLREKDAITLDNVIVFRTADKAVDDVLWAHELTHVRQYERWGVGEFARRYLLDRQSVEWPAYKAQFDYRRATRSADRSE